MSTVGMLGTLVLIVVLPCAIILCFFLHCYADYRRRNDVHALEAFRVQAQERRLMRQQQIRGREDLFPTRTANQAQLSHKNIKLSDFFYFHKIHKKHDDKSTMIPCQDKKNTTDKAENKTAESDTHWNGATEPDGFNLEDNDDDSDDLELCVPCSPKPTNHSTQQSFKGRFFGGTSGRGSGEKKNTKKTSNTPIPNDESAQTNTSHSSPFSRKDGVADDEECCCICLEGYAEGEVICITKQRGVDCNHIFHKECLSEWIKQNHDCCPLCRVVLIE